MLLIDRIIELSSRHPDWTSSRVAESLGCTPSYVRAALASNGIKRKIPAYRRGPKPADRDSDGWAIPSGRLSKKIYDLAKKGKTSPEICDLIPRIKPETVHRSLWRMKNPDKEREWR